MKRKICILIGLLMGVLLIRHVILSEYRFPNQRKTITSIRLMEIRDEQSGDPEDYLLLRELQQDEFAGFMDAIYALDTKRGGTPPRWGYGEHIACVTYADGDVEIFGTYCIGQIPLGEVWSGVGEYYFPDADAVDRLIRRYGDPS